MHARRIYIRALDGVVWRRAAVPGSIDRRRPLWMEVEKVDRGFWYTVYPYVSIVYGWYTTRVGEANGIIRYYNIVYKRYHIL